MRRTPALLTAATLLVLLTACGGGDKDVDDTEPTAEDTPKGGSAQCHDLLPMDEVEKLMAGDAIDPADELIGGLEACKWDGVTDPGASVTVVRAPAESWAQKLVPLIDQYEKTGALDGADKAKVQRARELLESETALTGDQACGIFTTMVVELQGLPKDSTRVVNWLPNQQQPQAVNIQTCEDGRYTSVQLIAGALKGNEAEEARLLEAYDALPD